MLARFGFHDFSDQRFQIRKRGGNVDVAFSRVLEKKNDVPLAVRRLMKLQHARVESEIDRCRPDGHSRASGTE